MKKNRNFEKDIIALTKFHYSRSKEYKKIIDFLYSKKINKLENVPFLPINLFKDLNSRFKNKFNIPFIFAVRNKNKNEIITEFKSRLENNDLNLEIKTSISQVKEIAKLRLTELINE